MEQPLVTVFIPTYNAEKTLERTLASLRMQSIPESQMEILVADGCSSDKTAEIARKYGAIVLENSKRLAVHAFPILFQNAHGHYILKTASDEALLEKDQLEKRFAFLNEHTDIHFIGTNRLLSPAYDRNNFSRSYLNRFGDPFTAFVYRTKDSVTASFEKNIIEKDEYGRCVLAINSTEPYPIADGGMSLFSYDYVKATFGTDINEISVMLQISEEIMRKTKRAGYIIGDDVLHTPKASFCEYIKKLKYRVVNNIAQKSISGYSNVANKISILNRRKYWFVLYALSIVFPFIHSVYYSIRYRDATLLAHCLYVYITMFLIVFYMLRRIMGFKDYNKTYG